MNQKLEEDEFYCHDNEGKYQRSPQEDTSFGNGKVAAHKTPQHIANNKNTRQRPID